MQYIYIQVSVKLDNRLSRNILWRQWKWVKRRWPREHRALSDDGLTVLAGAGARAGPSLSQSQSVCGLQTRGSWYWPLATHHTLLTSGDIMTLWTVNRGDHYHQQWELRNKYHKVHIVTSWSPIPTLTPGVVTPRPLRHTRPSPRPPTQNTRGELS